MSHFTVMVIGEDPEAQLAPFYENLETPRYVEYTREQMIAKVRGEIEDYKNGIYAEFLADPEKYKSGCKNSGHINYLENEFPKILNWTDEECFEDGIKYYEQEDIGENGEVYSTRNPKSKWDWYSLGGRWSGLIKLKDGAKGTMGRAGVFDNETGIDQAKKGDILNFDELVTFALIKDGKWYERGEMGWWALVANEKDQDEWKNEFLKLVTQLPDETLISIYDCHI